MKITLTIEKDIPVLTASGAISSKDIQVLRAGVGKLFRNGKNRIILLLAESQSIQNEILRELNLLDMLARELAGRIVLVCPDQSVRKKIEHFAAPPIIPCVGTVEEARKVFEAPPPADREAPQAAATPGGQAQEVLTLKEELRKREQSELLALRKQIAELKNENDILKTQFRQMFMERRQPVDAQGYQEKIKALEEQVKKLATPAKA